MKYFLSIVDLKIWDLADINGIFSYFLKYFLFYILIICDFFSGNKVFILLMVSLYKTLCKNVTLREHVLFFVQIILQLALTFIAHLKEEILNLTIFVRFSFLQLRNIWGHVLNISKTIFPKLTLHLRIS